MSGRKNVLLPYKLIENQSLSTSFSSQPITIQYLDNIGFAMYCTSVTDNTGKFIVEVSMDGDTWIDIEVDPEMQLSDVNENIVVNLNNLPFPKMRLSFTPAGGTPDGVVTAYVTAKEL